MAFSMQSLVRCLQLMEGRPKPWPIVCMGYPDMLIHPDVLTQMSGGAVMPLREDSREVMAWHGLSPDSAPGICEATAVLDQFGFQPTYLDIFASRGPEVLQDMNDLLAPFLRNRFAIVYDGGGLEHYFNVGQAMKNMLELAAEDGFIYHANPHTVGNHGFFNFCPTFYCDFYMQNGHTMMGEIEILVNGAIAGTAPMFGRYRCAGDKETWIQVIAQKKHSEPPHWPTQTKYLQNPTLKKHIN